MLQAWIAVLPSQEQTTGPVFLEFSEIEVATASFLRESVLAFKAFSRSTRACWYPVVSNASAATIEELDVVCAARSDTILTCRLSNDGTIRDIQLAGALDQKQREAYEFVTLKGSATAKQLMEATAASDEVATSPTAWNNRLSALVDKRIVSESQLGRQKVYTPVLMEGAHGH
jgi:hypothetical protein